MKKTLFVCATTLLVMNGCSSPDAENIAKEGLVLHVMTKQMLPDMKKEVSRDRQEVLKARSCYSKAKTLEVANSCNDVIQKKGFEIDDLNVWNKENQQAVISKIDTYLLEAACILEASNISEATECEDRVKKGLYKK